jgi:Holliday junction resolvasome RuvABC endonuclease subunit
VKVTGIDPSITLTGVAIFEDGKHPFVTSVKSKPLGSSITDRHRRLLLLRDEVSQLAAYSDLVVIETPAYDSRTGSQHDRSGNWWLIVNELLSLGFPVVEVPPTTMKKYATTRGNVDKDEVIFRAAKEFPTLESLTNDQADALWLAAMGVAHLDPETTTHTMTKLRHDQLKVVAW